MRREKQFSQLTLNLKPALEKSRPVNTLCLGPSSTGKTTAVKLLFNEIRNVSDVAIPVYVNRQIINSKQQVFAKIFESVYGYALPSYGAPFSKVYYSILKKILDDERVLIVALYDLNLILDDTVMNEVLHALIKAYEEVDGIKIGVIGISTDVRIVERFDMYVGSIFYPDEVFFPPHSREGIYDILASRVKYGFYPDVLSDEALERIVDLTYDAGDLRFRIYLLKMSGLEAKILDVCARSGPILFIQALTLTYYKKPELPELFYTSVRGDDSKSCQQEFTILIPELVRYK